MNCRLQRSVLGDTTALGFFAAIPSAFFNNRRTKQLLRRKPSGKASLLAGSSLLIFSSLAVDHAAAQSAPQASSSGSVHVAANDEPGIEEIVVTARRKSENIQQVPTTDIAVTAEALHNANIINFRDLSSVVPGLQLNEANDGVLDTFALRGVTYNPTAQAQPSVAFYLNDAPSLDLNIFQGLYDIGQIEVLEGPQGTIRGVPAPSGAITLRTRQPDLDAFGGYVEGTASTTQNLNANGAINIPLIDGVLGMRVAGVAESDQVNDVRSANNPARPYSRAQSERVSLLFEPNSQFTASVMYQNLNQTRLSFQQVIGPGYAPGFGTSPLAIPANYNGPPISLDQRLSVSSAAQPLSQVYQQAVWNAEYKFTADTSLTYVGSYLHDTNIAQDPQDPGNYFPGVNWYQAETTRQEIWTHEIRFQTNLTDDLEASAGAMYQQIQPGGSNSDEVNQLVGVTGANPAITPSAAPSLFPTPPKSIKVLPVNSNAQVGPYAGVTWHLDGTEVSASTRYVMNWGFSSEGAAPYIPTIIVKSPLRAYNWIYNASVKHQFTDDIMAYFTTGSSWRPNAAIANLIEIPMDNSENNPYLDSLLSPKPEQSTSYEVGAKTTWFDKRLLVNVSAYRQSYTNLSINPLPVWFLQNGSIVNSTGTTGGTFSTPVNAITQGVEAQAEAQVTDQWNIQAALDYSHGHVSGTDLPCNPPGYSGTAKPPLSAFTSAGKDIFLCSSDASIAQAPDFTLTLQTEYDVPLTDDFGGYIRALANIYGKNPYVDTVYHVPSYGLLSLYIGLRSTDGSWEGMLFAKNITNTQLATSEYASQDAGAGLGAANAAYGPSGYNLVNGMTPRQEFGINVTYNFGSH